MSVVLALGCDQPGGHSDAGLPDLPDAQLLADAGPPPGEYIAPFIAHGDFIYHWTGSTYERMFVRGVDLGVGMPGTQPGDLAPSYEEYMRWFGQMKEIGFDVVRAYTLHFPRFHRAVRDYNLAHPEDPIYVMQGVWLGSGGANYSHDLHELTADFTNLIEETIDAAHGNRVIEERFGRAYGTFDVDISEWVMGYIVGREVHGPEALTTDMAHPEDRSYEGTMVRLIDANPASVWAAARLDHALTHEWDNYGHRSLMAFASWMELDPLHHPTEPSYTGKDVSTIDMSRLDTFGVPQGHFLSYHVYPYFPRFISEQPLYQAYTDELGINSYLGYLVDLKAYHRGLPIMVTEYGVPSSWGLAQFSSSGMHHGGHSEAEQGRYLARMVHNIHDTGYAGAIAFHWMDGWFKRIWITNERTFPSERLRLWHDMMNPQQHYGMMAFELPEPEFSELAILSGSGAAQRVEAAADAEFFHARITLESALGEGEELAIGFDTYGDELGETRLPDGQTAPRRLEFLLEVTDEGARLTVMWAYDLYAILGARTGLGSHFQSVPSQSGDWRPIVWNTSGAHQSDDGRYRFEALDWEAGQLRVSRSAEPVTSHDAVWIDGDTVRIRIPWNLLQFTDPTTRTVMHDDRGTPDIRETLQSNGIALVVARSGELVSTARFAWEPWDEAPQTQERLKDSVEILSAALATIDAYPDRP